MQLLKSISILFALILISIAIYFTKDVRLDASSDTLIMKNDKTYEYFEFYNKIFPSKNFLVLAVKSIKKIDENYINNINKLKSEINKLDNIDSTFSIVDAPILLSNNLKIADLNNNKIINLNNTDQNINIILEEFSKSPIFKDQLINVNKNVSSIIIYIKKNNKYENIKLKKKTLDKDLKNLKKINQEYNFEKIKNNELKKEIIANIRNIINNKNDNYEYFLGGIDMISTDTISYVKNDIIIFSIAVIIFIIFVLFVIYREIKWVFIPLITSICSLTLMTGFIGYMKWEITAISSNFVSLMLILSISMNIHIINNYQHNYLLESKNKVLDTFKRMFKPCIYTILTTIVAFGSLLFSNIKPIIDFGYIMIFSLIIMFLTSFTILPLLLNFFPNFKKNNLKKNIILKKFNNFSINFPKKIIIINIIIFIISIYGIFKLNVENSFINYFKSNTQIYKGMKLIDNELGGTTPLDIIIKFKKDNIKQENINEINLNNIVVDEEIDLENNLIDIDDFEFEENLFLDNEININWFTQEKIQTVKKIHKYLESRNEIGKVQSIDSLIQMGNLINKKELSIFELSILYNEIPEKYKIDLVDPFLSVENNMVKISARIRDSEKIKRSKLINDLEYYIENEFSNIEEFKINGLLVLYNNMLSSLFSSQIKSFSIILITIFLMFLILFKSLKLSVIAIIPNIIASSFILGLIGIIGIPLDIMTITIAAITIGIAVDNTIHYIYRIKDDRNKIKNINNLLYLTNENVGKAVLTTSLTIAFGFSVLCLSNFIPTILFGIFTAFAMIVAMLGVLITLPSILKSIDK